MDATPRSTSTNDIGTSCTKNLLDAEVAIHQIPSYLTQLRGLGSHGAALQPVYFPSGMPSWYCHYVKFKHPKT